jgi:Flp pilus assembly protein TadG
MAAAAALRSLCGDRRGGYSTVAALVLPIVVGFAGLGTETGLWFYTHQSMQGAADTAAFSAATAFSRGGTTTYAADARAVAARYGYVQGVSGATVTVNRPPASGPNAGNASAIEVLIQQPQQRLFSALFINSAMQIGARAVARANAGTGCVLSLDPTASVDISASGTPQVVLNGCSMYDNSNSPTALTDSGSATISALSVSVVGGISGASHITTTNGIFTGAAPVADPYANVAVPPYSPSPCTDSFTARASGPSTMSPGVYCGGVNFNAGAVVNMEPGLYVIDGGSFSVNGGATITGNGVTLLFTSHTGTDFPNVTINGGAHVSLNAAADATTGPSGLSAMQGMVMYMDRRAPVGTAVRLNGGSAQNFSGAIYLPTANVTFTGGSVSNSSCLQLIADTISFGGNANFALNCDASGTQSIGGSVALVE